MQNNIFLIGPMGSGKTTIGHHLAKKLHKIFYDTDHIIEQQAGAKISWIFDIESEASFRIREKKVVQALTSLDNIILATGGGTILAEENRELLKKNGFVVYLTVEIEQQLQRVSHNYDRPLLQNDNPRIKLLELQQQRTPYYQQTAHYIIETSLLSVNEIVDQIIIQWKIYSS